MQFEHSVSNTATDQKCLVASLMQPVQDLQRALGNLVSRDIMGGAGNDLGGCVLRSPAVFQKITAYRIVMRPYDSSPRRAQQA